MTWVNKPVSSPGNSLFFPVATLAANRKIKLKRHPLGGNGAANSALNLADGFELFQVAANRNLADLKMFRQFNDIHSLMVLQELANSPMAQIGGCFS